MWTLDLTSDRPFHPARLLDRIEDLGSGALRARGCFWLPSRPGEICIWDGAGGQLSIGEAGPWETCPAHTHLVVTGVEADDAERVRQAFEAVLLSEAEVPTALARWAGHPDGLEPRLGGVEPRLGGVERLDEVG